MTSRCDTRSCKKGYTCTLNPQYSFMLLTRENSLMQFSSWTNDPATRIRPVVPLKVHYL